MQQNESRVNDYEDAGIDLAKVYRVLVENKRWVIGIPLLFLGLTFFALRFIQPKWEASGLIQIGQIWQEKGAISIENGAAVVERVKNKTFQAHVLTKLGIPLNEDDHLGKLYTDSIKIKVIPSTDLLELKVRAYSPKEATNWIQETVNYLQEVHKRLAEPTISRLQKQLVELKRQVLMVKSEKDGLIKNAELKGEIRPGNRFAENLLLTNYLLQMGSELREFELRQLALEEQLNLAKTFPTALMEQVYVPEKPVSPKKLLIVILATLIGVFIGIFTTLLINYARKDQTITS